jgi:hypothetical protein
MALVQVALVSILPQKFIHLPYQYYQLQEIEKHDFRVVPNGIMSIPNFIQICSALVKLNMQTQRWDMTSPMCSYHAAKLTKRNLKKRNWMTGNKAG